MELQISITSMTVHLWDGSNHQQTISFNPYPKRGLYVIHPCRFGKIISNLRGLLLLSSF